MFSARPAYSVMMMKITCVAGFVAVVAADDVSDRVKQQITDLLMLKLNGGWVTEDGGPAHWIDDDDPKQCDYSSVFQTLATKLYNQSNVKDWGLKFNGKDLDDDMLKAHFQQCHEASEVHNKKFNVCGITQAGDFKKVQKNSRSILAFVDFQKNFSTIMRDVKGEYAKGALNLMNGIWDEKDEHKNCLVNRMLNVTELCAAKVFHESSKGTTGSQGIQQDKAAGFKKETFWYTYLGAESGKAQSVPTDRAKEIKQCVIDNVITNQTPFAANAGTMENDKLVGRIVRDNIFFHLCAWEHQSIEDGCDRAEAIIRCVKKATGMKDQDKVMLDANKSSGDIFILNSCPSSCFPGSSSVLTRRDDFSLANTKISELQVGQEVVTATGATEKILGFVHKSDNAQVPMLSVTMENGSVLSATPDHLVFKADGQSTAMSSLEVGQELAVYDANAGHDANKITSIARKQTDGLYVPMTLSGTLVVDGAMVSAYANPSMRFVNFDHSAAHFAMAPVRHYMNSMYNLSILHEQNNLANNKALIVLPTSS